MTSVLPLRPLSPASVLSSMDPDEYLDQQEEDRSGSPTPTPMDATETDDQHVGDGSEHDGSVVPASQAASSGKSLRVNTSTSSAASSSGRPRGSPKQQPLVQHNSATSNQANVTYHNTTNINIHPTPTTDPIASPTNNALTQFLPSPTSQLLESPSNSTNPLLSNFQTHALSTVQNLAASFGNIATVLQKDQAHQQREEESTRKKLHVLQNSVANLTAQNKELAALLVRTGEKSTAQARELNEKVNNLNNRLVVGFKEAGISTEGTGTGTGGTALQSRRGSQSDVTASSTLSLFGPPTTPGASGASSSDIQSLLERMTRMESELTFQRVRAERSEANLVSYTNRLQEQLKRQQAATVALVTQASNNLGGDAVVGENMKQAIQQAFQTVQETVFEPIGGSVGTFGSQFAVQAQAPAPVHAQLPPELRTILSELVRANDESALREQALLDTVLGDSDSSTTGKQSVSNTHTKGAFELRLAQLQKQMKERREQVGRDMEKLKKEKDANASAAAATISTQAPPSTSGHARVGSSTPATDPSVAGTTGTATAVASTPNDAPSAAAPLTADQLRALVNGLGGGSSSTAAGTTNPSVSPSVEQSRAQTPFGTAGPAGRISVRQPSSSAVPTSDGLSFTPRSISVAEQLRMDQALEQAAAIAVANAQSAAKATNVKDPFLSAEALAATAASHAAQIAAKQAQEVLASIMFMKESGQFNPPQPTAATNNPATDPNVLHDLLFDDAPETTRGALAASKPAMKKIQDRLTGLEKSVWTLESTVSSLGNQLGDLSRSTTSGKESTLQGMKSLGSDFSNILTQFQSLSRQFQSQHKVLDGRISQYRDEFDLAIKHSIDALSILEKSLDKKADMKLVLDKVSRSEYLSSIKQLKKVDDELLNRSVNREEYRLQLNEIREVMSEDQRERISNITRIANELSKLVTDLDQKASKQELIDIASVLNSMPKVTDEVEHLKAYVNAEINTRATEILDVTIDRKQLKRSMQRLLKSLSDEVSSATLPVNCDACALRTGIHSGTNCLSCAQQMKLNARLATYVTGSGSASPDGGDHTREGSFEVLASRGGGFMVTTHSSASPSPPSTAYGSSRRPGSTTGTSVSRQLVQGEYRATRPGTRERPGTSGSGFAKTTVLPAASGATVDHFPLPGPSGLPPTPLTISGSARPGSLEVGSDGKVYNGRGSRTHRLVASSSGKSRARAEEEFDSGSGIQLAASAGAAAGPWQEQKDEVQIKGSQSARVTTATRR